MKIRLGFVPNSSSSSFIVKVWSHFYLKKGRKLSKEIEQKIIKFGFKKTNASFPEQYDYFKEHCSNKESLQIEPNVQYRYGYAVSCNQDDVIEFLVKYRIPFKASIHYGHYTYFYDGGDFIYNFPNYGLMFHMENGGDITKTIGEMVMHERGIEMLPISQFMNKADQDRYSKELKIKWNERLKKIKEMKAKR